MKKGHHKNIRMLNGYRVIYKPDHRKAMKSDSWDGYVFEHILIAEKYLGRNISDTEVVHHLDGKKDNNSRSNLLVLESSQHSKLHRWLDSGAPYSKEYGENGMNSGKPNKFHIKNKNNKFCKICSLTLQDKQKNYCSIECQYSDIDHRHKVKHPTKEILLEDVKNMSMEAVGGKYKVSSNAVRKWCRKYEISWQS